MLTIQEEKQRWTFCNDKKSTRCKQQQQQQQQQQKQGRGFNQDPS